VKEASSVHVTAAQGEISNIATLAGDSHRQCICGLPVKGLAIKWPSCELLGDGWTIDRANPS
jgi:hypothetical protein